MAQQESFIKFKGKIGDLTFYKSKRGYLARTKGGVDGARIATDPKFKRTRENGAEFGRAAQAAKLFRDSLTQVINQSKDHTMSNRLSALMLKVIQQDAINDRGERLVLDAETEMLKGFEFNNVSVLSSVLRVDIATEMDRANGELKVSIPAFSPASFLKIPQGATHAQFKAFGLSLNFLTGEKEYQLQQTTEIDLNAPFAGADLICSLSANVAHPLFLIFGIDFYQKVNQKSYSINNGVFNSVSIVDVLGL